MFRRYAFFILAFLTAGVAFAAEAPPQMPESPQLVKCLKRADDLPDMAAAEAAVWIKKEGGNDAHLCRAFAQSNRGMHADAAREFWGLASFYDKHDAHRAILMHNLSGQEFLRAKDAKNAEGQYAAALKIAPTYPDSLIGRAEVRMEAERYWDALDDLNHALAAEPDNINALRQRGRAWMELGNDKKAEEDLTRADELDASVVAP